MNGVFEIDGLNLVVFSMLTAAECCCALRVNRLFHRTLTASATLWVQHCAARWPSATSGLALTARRLQKVCPTYAYTTFMRRATCANPTPCTVAAPLNFPIEFRACLDVRWWGDVILSGFIPVNADWTADFIDVTTTAARAKANEFFASLTPDRCADRICQELSIELFLFRDAPEQLQSICLNAFSGGIWVPDFI